MTRMTMKKIKADAAAKRAAYLNEMEKNDITIFELALTYGISPQAMGQKIKKARVERETAVVK